MPSSPVPGIRRPLLVSLEVEEGQVAQVSTTRVAEASLLPGLRAEIADPLWMIGRQLQFGELAGEDASTPVRAHVELDRVPLDTTQPGGQPPEVFVEAESPADGAGARRLAADLGLLLKRALFAGAASATWAALVDATARWPMLRLDPADADDAELRLLLRGSLNGLWLADHLKSAGGNLRAALAELLNHDPGPALEVVAAWLKAAASWCARLGPTPIASWQVQTQSYAASIATQNGGELHATRYTGGRLDWSSFDLRRAPRVDPAPGPDNLVTVTSAPTLARLPKAPSARFWEIEGEPVELGGLDIGPDEPLRVALAEYSLLAGDDRFVLAVPVDRGALVRLRSVVVFDAFTYRRPPPRIPTLTPARERPKGDRVAPLKDDQFRVFELTGSLPAPEGVGPWLLVPAGLSSVEQGPEVDRLQLIYDEEANLGWAVEQLIEGPHGSAVSASAARLDPSESPNPGDWELQVWSGAPQGWFPLVLDHRDKRLLHRGHMASQVPNVGPELPKGALLRPLADYKIRQAALPVGGLVVTRRWQRSRDASGRVWLWFGRQTRPGSALTGPGLVVDELRGL